MACRQCADDVSGADNIRTCADDMRMMCRRCADDIQMTCRRCADDMHMMPGAVLHEIWQLRQEQLCIKPKMASLFSIFFIFPVFFNVSFF